jgi:hypothetical protein
MKHLEVIEMRKILGGTDPDNTDPSIPPDEPVLPPEGAAKYVYFKPGKTLR